MKQKHILFVGLLAFLVVSCSDLEQIEKYTGDSVKVTAGIAGSRVGFSEMDNVTYAHWQDGDGITLFTESQGNLDYSSLISNEGNTILTFLPEDTSLKDIDGEEVFACYPSSKITAGVVQLPSTEEWYDNRPMPFAYAVSSIRDSEVNLQFKHIFSYLKFTVTPEILSDPSKAIRKVTVSTSSDSPLSTGEGDTFDFSTLEADITYGSNSVRIPTDTLLVETSWTVYIPVLPQPSGADITITLTGDEDEVLYTHTKATPSTGFEVGNVYRVGTAVATSYLVDGPTFNASIKDLVNGIAIGRGVYDIDEKIAKIEFLTEVQTVPEEYIVVSAEGSPVPIYASFNATDSILKVSTVAKKLEIVDASYMFNNLNYLGEINFGKFKITEKTTNINSMFSNCSKLTDLDLSNWNIMNVKDLSYVFHYCFSLTDLEISNWNTSNVTKMTGMFTGCSKLSNLNVSNWNTANVTSLGTIFLGCESLTELDVSDWNTSNVTDLYRMFSDCSSLTTIDVANWNTSNVTDMSDMFSGCSSLISLDISGWDTVSVTDMSNMFSGCSSLVSLDLSGFDTFGVIEMSSMFFNCSSLTMLNLLNWTLNPQNSEINDMFEGCASISKACKITSTQEFKGYLLGYTGTTQMNTAWFIWGDATNDGSSFDNIPKEEW